MVPQTIEEMRKVKRERERRREGEREQDYKRPALRTDADTEPNRNIDLRVNAPRSDTVYFVHNSL